MREDDDDIIEKSISEADLETVLSLWKACSLHQYARSIGLLQRMKYKLLRRPMTRVPTLVGPPTELIPLSQELEVLVSAAVKKADESFAGYGKCEPNLVRIMAATLLRALLRKSAGDKWDAERVTRMAVSARSSAVTFLDQSIEIYTSQGLKGFPLVWDLFKYVLGPQTRSRVFDPAFADMLAMYLEARQKYPSGPARLWLHLAFTLRTIGLVLECSRVSILATVAIGSLAIIPQSVRDAMWRWIEKIINSHQ